MQIQRSDRANDLFLTELARLMPKEATKDDKDTPKEEMLEKDRKEKGQEAEADKTTETQLPEAGERKDDPPEQTFEGQLEENRKDKKAAAPNSDKQGITEERLNTAEKTTYPHRNPEAHERTGNKRPINALREEMGNASDEAKRERYEKAAKAGKKEKRILDEDIGKQKTLSFNLKSTKTAAIEACKDYIAYKDATEGTVKTAANKFSEISEVDTYLAEIMETAQQEARPYSHDELAKIAALKIRKSELLKVAQNKKKVCDHHAQWEEEGDYEITNDGGECEACVRNNESKYDPPDPDYGPDKTAKRKSGLLKVAQDKTVGIGFQIQKAVEEWAQTLVAKKQQLSTQQIQSLVQGQLSRLVDNVLGKMYAKKQISSDQEFNQLREYFGNQASIQSAIAEITGILNENFLHSDTNQQQQQPVRTQPAQGQPPAFAPEGNSAAPAPAPR